MAVTATIESNGEQGAVILNDKAFKTGSRGYFGQGKVTINGKRYQVQVQAVEIGSRPAAPDAGPAETAS